ncbi:MAG: hypothetical protein CMB91_03560 [Flammeovirgaceae bacterium]|nr:hypothetical protein [Flammeovirgaceae bacterium]|tara:strand:+ start:28716 stop:29555 length:840 start_codon:yes stop_codon:yes gene_type:complete
MNRSFFVFLLLICQSCDWFVKNQQQDKDVVAQVGSSFFYVDDIVYDSSLGDSTKVVSQQINLWLKKQLVLNAAFQNEEIINEIENKVSSYRDNLVLFEFEKYLFANSFNEKISNKEIINYYEENKNDFILPFSLVKTLYAKIPDDAPSINIFRNNLRKYPNSDTTEIISYCFQFAEKSFLEDSTWIKFDDILMNVPFSGEVDKINFLKSRTYHEIKEEGYVHFIRILDKKLIGDFSPISFEEEIINTILLNNRKQDLFDNLRDSIFSNSVKGVDYEIYK